MGKIRNYKEKLPISNNNIIPYLNNNRENETKSLRSQKCQKFFCNFLLVGRVVVSYTFEIELSKNC